MLADQFTQIFRYEHRKVRDLLLNLIQVFQDRDRVGIHILLNQTTSVIGPHFRYEEEALYPAVVGVCEADYVERLLRDHDLTIGVLQRLIELARKELLTDEDIAEATRLIQRVLSHVSDCEGLSIVVERLSDEKVRLILDARARSARACLSLLQWAKQVRSRPAVLPG